MLKSPSIEGSASGRSQAMTICGSLRTISAARSTRTEAFASSASISLEPSRPGSARGQMQERHRRKGDEQDGEADDGDWGSRSGQPATATARRIEAAKRFVGARAGRDQERERRRGGDARSAAPLRAPPRSGEDSTAEPPQRQASSRAREAQAPPAVAPTGSLRQEGPNQLRNRLTKCSPQSR